MDNYPSLEDTDQTKEEVVVLEAEWSLTYSSLSTRVSTPLRVYTGGEDLISTVDLEV